MSNEDRSDLDLDRTRRDVLKHSATLGSLGILPATAAASDPPPSSAPQGGGDSDTAAGTQVGTAGVSTAATGGTDALVVRDCAPWNRAANDVVLDDLGTDFSVIGSNQLTATDLSKYGVVVLPSTQHDSFYDHLVDAADALEQFVRNGGTLVAHVTDAGRPCTTIWDDPFLPEDVGHETEYRSSLDLVHGDHPIYEGVSDAELDGWNYSSHGWLTNVPDDATVLVEDAGNGSPVHVTYEVGSGTVVASTQTLEWPFRSEQGTEAVLRNELEWALSQRDDANLAIENPRLVQTVENTRVEEPVSSGSLVLHEEPDPNLATNRNTMVLFDLDGTDVDTLDESVTLVVERVLKDVQNDTRTFEVDELALSPSEVESFVEARDGIEAFDDFTGIPDPIPTFELDPTGYRTQSVTVRLDTPDVESVSAQLNRVEDFTVHNSHTLHVGFTQVRDPESGVNYGSSNDGKPQDYKRAVKKAVEYLENVYPVDEVVAYCHDEPVVGSYQLLHGQIEAIPGRQWTDAEQSRTVLDQQLPVEKSDTYGGSGRLSKTDGFDETVLIVPDGYFNFHSDGKCGVHLGSNSSQPQFSSLVSENCAETTTAHELVHHFTQSLYDEDGNVDPMAQRKWSKKQNEVVTDEDHARSPNPPNDGDNVTDSARVRLTKFDLTNGYFNAERDVASVMSYTSDTEWADSRMFQQLLTDGLSPQPPETSYGKNGTNEARTQDATPQPVVSGVGSVESDGSLTIHTFTRREGYPMASEDDGEVTLTVRTADGTEIGQFTTAAEWDTQVDGSDGDVANVVPFVLPYPADATEVVVERDGTTTSVDPLARLLDGVTDRIADESFDRKPQNRRRTLSNKLDAVSKQVRTGAYRGASNKLDHDVRKRIEQWLVADADVAANRYSRSDLLDLVDDAVARLETLAETGGSPDDDRKGNGRGNNGKGNGRANGR